MSRTTRIATTASLILFLGITVMWVRSYWASDGIGRRQHAVSGWTDARVTTPYARSLSVYTFEGGVAFETAAFLPMFEPSGLPTAEPAWTWHWGSDEPKAMPVNNRTLANRLGFGHEGYAYSTVGQNMVGQTYAARPLAGVTAALPAVVSIRRLARRSPMDPSAGRAATTCAGRSGRRARSAARRCGSSEADTPRVGR